MDGTTSNVWEGNLRGSLSVRAGGGPIYMRLAAGLREAISSGRLPMGVGLPAERDMARDLGLSRQTVRHAVEQLAAEGLLRVRQGSGTFVSTRIVEPLSVLESFSEDMRRRGYVPGSNWLSRDVVHPNPEEAMALGLSLANFAVRGARVRTANGEPMAVERATVAAKSVGGMADFGDSLYEAMRRHGAAPVRALQRVRAAVADSETARLLNMAPGAAVLETERRSFTTEGCAVELTRSVYRGDLYDYVVEMRIAAPTNHQEDLQ